MSRAVHIQGWAVIDREGLKTAGKTTAWGPDRGPGSVERAQVLDKPYPSFGKLVMADRLAFSAACLLFSGTAAPPGDRTGICMAAPFGSLSADLRYMEATARGVPSPGLFSATLPSSPATEIAICFKLKGPNRVFTQAGSSAVAALDAACRLIETAKADHVLFLYLDAVEGRDAGAPFLPPASARSPCACALLLSAAPQPGPDGLTLSADLRFTDGDFPAGRDEEYLYRLIRMIGERTAGAIEVSCGGFQGRVTVGRFDGTAR